MIKKTYRPRKRKIPLKRYVPMTLVLILGFCGSMVFYSMVRNYETQAIQSAFEARARLIADTMQSRFNEYEGTLQFVRDFFYNSVTVNRQEFSNFVKGAIYRYPAIQALAWNPRVTDAEREAFEESVRKEGFDGFQIVEKSRDGKPVRAFDRVAYFPVCYIDPIEENKAALGFDISSETVRRQAVIKGFQTGKPAASHRLFLFPEQEEQYSVLLLLAVYNPEIHVSQNDGSYDNLRGFVVEVLKIGDVVNRVMDHFPEESIDLSLFDLSAPDDQQFLYLKASNGGKERMREQDRDRVLYNPIYKRPLHIGGNLWEIRFSSTPGTRGRFLRYQSWITLLGSLGIVCMLAFYLHKKMVYTFEIEEAIETVTEINSQLETEVNMRKQEESKLLTAKQRLEKEVWERTQAEKQRDRVIEKLTRTLAEVNTLRGILPLCSYCKKIRDDKGYWEQVDVYIHKYSQADISHSVCPECLKRYFPDEYREIYPDNQSKD
jgi:CHASE1-domain containing sensor protein